MPLIEQVANVWRIKDLRRKLLITIGFLCLCRVGSFIPVPGIDTAGVAADLEKMSGGDGAGALVGFMNTMAGGALSKGAIFGLGVMPYISASIIFQLLATVIPSLERLRKEGEAGRKKLNQYMRVATIFICMLQATMIVRSLYGGHITATSGAFGAIVVTLVSAFSMTVGTMMLMWIGEQIDSHGIGNGISMIIMVNILVRLPAGLWQMREQMASMDSQQSAILKTIFLVAFFIADIAAIIYITRGERRIPVQAAKHVRGAKVYGGQKQYLPLKVNTSGVMPLIFASALLQFPAIIAGMALRGMAGASGFMVGFLRFVQGATMPGGNNGLSLSYVILNGLLIFFFCYFWTAIMFNPKEIADNLKEQGHFIPGIRPGSRTAEYLEGIMNRITFAGSAFLILIALLPMLVVTFLQIPWTVAGFYGGTSILIVVGVALDLVNRINQQLEMRRYSGFAAGASGRRRSRRR